ncbi:MAG: hypothetical protein A2X40_09185 [Elusimicrobia bacterium GWC2_65_9]|nr:MAG: hypothetical protein A2X40_09185 [Elusimicrobia bacterium GWC2_65_9]
MEVLFFVVGFAFLGRVGTKAVEALARVHIVLQARVDVVVAAEDAAVFVLAQDLALVLGPGAAQGEAGVFLRVIIIAVGRNDAEVVVVGQRGGVDLLDAVVLCALDHPNGHDSRRDAAVGVGVDDGKTDEHAAPQGPDHPAHDPGGRILRGGLPDFLGEGAGRHALQVLGLVGAGRPACGR